MLILAFIDEHVQGGHEQSPSLSPEDTIVAQTGVTTPATTAVTSPTSSPQRTKPKRFPEDKVLSRKR